MWKVMILILEGCDKTGKSTLAAKLSKELGFPILKTSAPKKGEDPYREYVTKILTSNENIIFDRFHLGELVYGPIYRKKSQLDQAQFRSLELLLKARDARIIYCEAPKEFILQKFKEDNETFAQPSDIQLILDTYKSILSKTSLPVTIHSIQDNLAAIEAGETPDPLLINSRYVGALHPEILFIGEKNNLNARQKYSDISLPFDFGKSSELLHQTIETLKLTKVGFTKVGFTNVFKAHIIEPEVNQDQILLNEIQALQPKVVVALGNTVHKKLIKVDGLNVVHLTHPSYLARWKSKNSRELYAKEFSKIKL